jgi:nucleoid-associated protein YgaU
MQIWLKQDKEKLRLPVLPSGFGVTNTQQNTTVNITAFGEINLIGKRGLKTLSLSSFFPNREYGFVQYMGFPKPYDCVELIESWMDNPIQVTITGTNINLKMTIESFTYSEQDGTGDIYYTLDLKEYKKPAIKVKQKVISKTSTKIETASTKRVSKTVRSTTYIVKQGDNLSDIAKRLTGDSSNYIAISNQNNISNPNCIKVGQKLVIKV